MHALVGDRTGETYRLGDVVRVKLVEAAPLAGALRFELLSEGRVITSGQRKGLRAAARGKDGPGSSGRAGRFRGGVGGSEPPKTRSRVKRP